MIRYEDGIYRTTRPLPRSPSEVGANQLVLIRTDGDFGPASVLAPQANVHNQWRFSMPGVRLTDADDLWGRSLVRLPPEGFYALTQDKVFAETNRWPAGALVQLGYNRGGEPIFFIARRRVELEENDLFFAKTGQRLGDEWLTRITPILCHDEGRSGPL